MPTILLIDDSPQIGALLRQIPRLYADWQLLIATDGPRGIELFRQHLPRIDAILLDVLMPGLDGYWTCFALRKLSQHIPIIPFTGAEQIAEELFQQFACTTPVRKPITLDALIQRLRDAINAVEGVPPMEYSPLVAFVQRHAAQLEQQLAQNSDSAAQLQSERQIVDGVALEDLDLNQVAQHLAFATRYRGYDGPTAPLDFLHQYGFLVELEGMLYPTLAGVLAFTPRPERWLGAAGIDIVQFSSLQPSTQAIAFQHQVRGPILDLLNRTVELLWTRVQHTYHIETTERIEEHEYPMAVLRELTVNALAHRDWSYAGARVRIQLFPDRLEWLSPGSLPTGVTPATMRQTQVSRNPVLMRFLYLAGRWKRSGWGSIRSRIRCESMAVGRCRWLRTRTY